MAGQGPAPKAHRQRRNVPLRGDWLDLPPLEAPALPALPSGKAAPEWHPRTRAAWRAWRSDPVTALYGPSELQNAIDLAYIYDEWVCGGRVKADEVRQWLDRLGLNAKGKRDLRWRLLPDAPVEPESAVAPRRDRPPAV